MSVSGSTRVARADPSCIEKLEAVIDQMPANPEPRDERLTMRQLVHRLYQKILHLKALGYGIRFICKLLQTHSGLPFKEHTLATYLSLEKLGGRGTTRRSRSSRSVSAGRSVSTGRSVAPGKRRSTAVVQPLDEPRATIQPLADVEGQDAAPSQDVAEAKLSPVLSPERGLAQDSPEPATTTAALLQSEERDQELVNPDWVDDEPVHQSSLQPEPVEPEPVEPEPVELETAELETAELEADISHESISQAEVQQPSESDSSRQPRSWREDDPGNPPAPEPYLNEPTFNTIERD